MYMGANTAYCNRADAALIIVKEPQKVSQMPKPTKPRQHFKTYTFVVDPSEQFTWAFDSFLH